MKKHLITWSCSLFVCVLLLLCLFGGLKVNASQTILNRYENVIPIPNNNYASTLLLMQIPRNTGVIENDDHTYDFVKVSFNDNTNRTYIGLKRNGTDSFLVYGYNGTNYNKTIFLSQFLYIYLYNNSTTIYANFYIMGYNTTTRELEVQDTIAESVDIGAYYGGKSITTYGIAYGHFYGSSGYNTIEQRVSALNSWIAPNYGDVFDAMIADSYSRGYSSGYTTGYEDGQETITPFDRFWAILTGVFSSVGAVLSIQLFPGVPLGLFILIPLFFGAVGLILWIWRRN